MDNDPRYKQVKTQPIKVKAILIDGTKIEGYLHLTPNLRLIDLLNYHAKERQFIAVTDANIFFPDGQRNHFKFFSLNRNMIVCCFPKED